MNILDTIIEQKKTEVSELYKNYSCSSFSDTAFFNSPCLPFTASLIKDPGLSIIAEVKKASPSKGIIREDFSHLDIALSYIQAGVCAMSVLTDRNFFQGNIHFLNDIAAIKTIPVLRKDFIIDVIQIFEAKANGADAILLIAEALTKEQINELSSAAKETGLDVLLEIHSEDQLDKIDFNINSLIGINNRNLTDFVTDINTTVKLSSLLPENIAVVSESGINSEGDIMLLKQTRVSALLMGEYFMRQKDVSRAVAGIKKWCGR